MTQATAFYPQNFDYYNFVVMSNFVFEEPKPVIYNSYTYEENGILYRATATQKGGVQYAYCNNNPINVIDPDGRMGIFINGGNVGRKNRGNAGAWHGADVEIKKRTGDYAAVYRHGGGNLFAGARARAGERQALKDIKAGVFGKLEDGESIKVITHSMGADFGKGYIKGLQKNLDLTNNPIEFELDLMPWSNKTPAVDGVPTTAAPNYQDSWAGQKDIPGSTDFKPFGDSNEKSSLKGHSLKNVTPEVINERVQPSNNNPSQPRNDDNQKFN